MRTKPFPRAADVALSLLVLALAFGTVAAAIHAVSQAQAAHEVRP